MTSPQNPLQSKPFNSYGKLKVVDENYKIPKTKTPTRKYATSTTPSARNSVMRFSKPSLPLGVGRVDRNDIDSEVSRLKMAHKKKIR